MTLPWRGKEQRRTVRHCALTALPPPELRACFCHFCPQAFFKFNSHATSYSGEYFDPAAFSELSARERMILSPPDARESAEEDGAQAARMGPKL